MSVGIRRQLATRPPSAVGIVCRCWRALGCSISCCKCRICCESRSILRFCSSIFFVRLRSSAASELAGGVGLCACGRRTSGESVTKENRESAEEARHGASLASPFEAGKPAAVCVSRAFTIAFFHARTDGKTSGAGAVGAKTRRWRRAEISRRFQAGHARSAQEDAQGGSEPIEALPAAHRPVTSDSLGASASDFPALLRRHGLLNDPALLVPSSPGTADCRVSRQRRRRRFSLSSSPAAFWWRATGARPRATQSFTIARIKCSKSIGTRSWRSRACRRRLGKWRACSNIRFNIFAAPNSRR